MYTRGCIHGHGLPFRYAYNLRISDFSISRSLDYRSSGLYAWGFSVSGLGASLAASCHRHRFALALSHSWPSTSMAHYRQQHPVNHNAAQVARIKPSQYDRLSTMDNGTNTMFFVTVVWRQQWHCWQSSSINPLLQHNRTSVRECRNKSIVGNRSHRVVFTPPGI